MMLIYIRQLLQEKIYKTLAALENMYVEKIKLNE